MQWSFFEMITVIITEFRKRDWSKLGNFAIVPIVVSACQSGLHSQSQSFKSQFAKAAALNCRLGCRAPADGSLMTGSLTTPSIWLTFFPFSNATSRVTTYVKCLYEYFIESFPIIESALWFDVWTNGLMSCPFEVPSCIALDNSNYRAPYGPFSFYNRLSR